MVVSGAEGSQQDAGEKSNVCRSKPWQASQLAVAVNVPNAPQADNKKREIRRDIAEVVDAEQGPLISELMVGRVLWYR